MRERYDVSRSANYVEGNAAVRVHVTCREERFIRMSRKRFARSALGRLGRDERAASGTPPHARKAGLCGD